MAETFGTAEDSAMEHAEGAMEKAFCMYVDAEERLQTLFGFYRDMLRIRRFEEKAGQLYGLGRIGGFCHLYIGQEAVVVGTQHALRPKSDATVTSYRDHGHMLACGADPKVVMAELLGRATGCSAGKGGSMHMFSPENGFWGGHGIVGAQVPVGTGIGFAIQYRKKEGICAVFLGDGAVNQGQVYESFNMAALWKLPVVYIIENNRYGMGTSIDRSSARSRELHRRGEAYGIHGVQVNGMNVLSVFVAARKAVEAARKKQGPQLLEMLTYRYRGHSMSDPANYRPREEVRKVRGEQDPIAQLRKRILQIEMSAKQRLSLIEQEVRAEIAAAAKTAQDPEPDVSSLKRDVYFAPSV